MTAALGAFTLATGVLTVLPATAAPGTADSEAQPIRATVRSVPLSGLDQGALVTSPAASTPVARRWPRVSRDRWAATTCVSTRVVPNRRNT